MRICIFSKNRADLTGFQNLDFAQYGIPFARDFYEFKSLRKTTSSFGDGKTISDNDFVSRWFLAKQSHFLGKETASSHKNAPRRITLSLQFNHCPSF